MKQVNDQTGASRSLQNPQFWAGSNFGSQGEPAINKHTHVNILTLLTPSGIRQKLWSLRLIVIMGRPGSKATMEGEMLPEIIEDSPVGDMA
ncbi:MAG TPA: hypothetical protein VMT53_27565 [Terriglobales bacterium]|nr:hypothetical protein [Terriglobales bacterium]